jgi:AraC family transcriptional regulator, regulatory protein of adaptative response / methylated-DNA-[protein]-cysteine methyltransferase
MTFLELARYERLRLGVNAMSKGNRVIDAQIDAGYDSPSAFREAIAKLIGKAPGTFEPRALVRMDWISTPLGTMVAAADKTSLHLLEFIDRPALKTELHSLGEASRGSVGFGRTTVHDALQVELNEYFKGTRAEFTSRLSERGTDFDRLVWQELRRIPAGETRTYGQIAARISLPTAARSVARANGRNAIAIINPCHRVIGSDGGLTGYGGGLWRKQKLLEVEMSYLGRMPSNVGD